MDVIGTAATDGVTVANEPPATAYRADMCLHGSLSASSAASLFSCGAGQMASGDAGKRLGLKHVDWLPLRRPSLRRKMDPKIG
ncbi:MAG: hypothetical protein JO033_23390 [Acidobacteriaceae bacterium]|nr:hypothetical protein [Acidobacteriaceae bacterium]